MAVRILENFDGSRYAVMSYGSGRFKVKAHDLGNGHMEVSGVERVDWKELEWTSGQIQDHLDMLAEAEEEDTDKRARALAIAANRAKTRVRKLCKAMGADTLMTLTYKANQTDQDLCKRHLKEFVRRVRRVIPDFRAVCGFEEQKRGAWHVHMATVKLPSSLKASNGVLVKSFNVLRAIWRSVTKEHGGNVDVSARKRHSQRSAARIAAYLSKYITKAFEDGEKWSNRWTKFGDVTLPAPIDLGEFESIGDAMKNAALCYLSGRVDTMHMSRWGDWFYFAFEGGPDSGGHHDPVC
ncbi:hypothetical protein [Acidovorax sp. A79]|uniref:rolling circle replication-associated protein n=1 Tax=Acidovorax sp. A79 TaxID=3056107 RepID=UPI0034E85F36